MTSFATAGELVAHLRALYAAAAADPTPAAAYARVYAFAGDHLPVAGNPRTVRVDEVVHPLADPPPDDPGDGRLLPG